MNKGSHVKCLFTGLLQFLYWNLFWVIKILYFLKAAKKIRMKLSTLFIKEQE